MAALHALIVGIDSYMGGISALSGCRNDATRAHEFLQRYAMSAGLEHRFTLLLDQEATRAGFVETFRERFASTARGDTALLWFSGHGSQEQAPPEHLAFEPDGLNETIVLADSRVEGGHDLADKELAVLVSEVSSRGVHVVVVLDCCHSGSGLREVDPDVTGVRRAPTVRGRRDVESYLSGTLEQYRGGEGSRLGAADYVLIAACRSDQTAKEIRVDDGGSRGALSLALEEALTAESGQMTCLQLQRSVATAVRAKVSEQSPVLECHPADAAHLPFLGGDTKVTGPLLVAWHTPSGWRLDAGALHGIPSATSDGRQMRITLHPLTARELDEEHAVAVAHTGTVRSGTSDLVIDSGAEALNSVVTYRAMVRELPTERVSVWVDPLIPGRAHLLDALKTAQGLLLTEDPGAALALRVEDQRLVIVRPGATRSLVAAHPLGGGLTEDDMETLRDELVHVGRWLSLRDRRNPTPVIADSDLHVELLDTADQPLPIEADGDVRVLWREDLDDWPRIRLRITNGSSRRLFVTALSLSNLYGVRSFFHGEGEWLDPSATTYVPAADGTTDLYVSVPEGEMLTEDILMVVASNQEFNSRAFELPELGEPPSRQATTRGPRLSEKGISDTAPPTPPARTDSWITRQITVTTYRPTAFLPLDGNPVDLSGHGVVLEHPMLKGTARLVPSSQGMREAMVPLLPPALADDPESSPFSFIPARSTNAEVDVLELQDVENPKVVTEEDPIVLRIPQRLAKDEVILPLMFDGEDYLPLGIGVPVDEGTEIRLNRLPTQGEATTRSLGGSLKILFRKLVAKRLGAGYDWPHLALVTYGEDREPTYEHNPSRVREALAGAQTALLVVHGILGDTRDLTQAAGRPEWGLAHGMDAVLALDYENLHTSIETSGFELAAALRAVGIEGEQSPRLTVVAHSMGGLVSRCFIERFGGSNLVELLVTCGTPHQGSPWPRIQDGIRALLGLSLNGLAVGGPLATIGTAIAFLARATEKIDTALDEMRSDSQLLQSLSHAADPGVPYTTIRGTQPWPSWADDAVAARIIRKLARRGLETVFGNEGNDIAVSISSAAGVGATWARSPRIIDVDCNHMGYFSSDVGLTALREALQERMPSERQEHEGTED